MTKAQIAKADRRWLKKRSIKNLIMNVASAGMCFQAEKISIKELKEERNAIIREINRRIKGRK